MSGKDERPAKKNVCARCHYWHRINESAYGRCGKNLMRYLPHVSCNEFESERRK